MPAVACTNCAFVVDVSDEKLGEDHTCEQCGTTFVLAVQPEESGAPEHVTISMGKAFQDRGPNVSPEDADDANPSNTVKIIGIVVGILVFAVILIMVL